MKDGSIGSVCLCVSVCVCVRLREAAGQVDAEWKWDFTLFK